MSKSEEAFNDHLHLKLGEVRNAMGRLHDRTREIDSIYRWVDRLFRDVVEHRANRKLDLAAAEE